MTWSTAWLSSGRLQESRGGVGGGKVAGVKDIKEPRGQAAGRVACADTEVLGLQQEEDGE